MTSIPDFARRAEKLIVDHSPSLLTAVGVTGSITAAFLTGKATLKATRLLDEEYQAKKYLGDDKLLEPRDVVMLVWKEYIPAGGVLVVTVVAIVAANHIGGRRAAAVAAAYSISERAFTEYKEKVVEKFGANKESSVRDEIAQDRVNRNPPVESQVIITGAGNVMCLDEYSGRYFLSDMETIKKAQNDTNYQILHEMYASLSDFYDRIGLDRTTNSEEVGWNTDKQLDLRFSTTMTPDQKPCISFEFTVTPIRNYHRFL